VETAPKSLFEEDKSRPRFTPPVTKQPNPEMEAAADPRLFVSKRRPLVWVAIAGVVAVLVVLAALLMHPSNKTEGTDDEESVAQVATQAPSGMTFHQFAQPPAGYAD